MKIFNCYIFRSKASEVPENVVVSEPPENKQQVTNIYRNPDDNRLVVVHKAT